MSSIRVASVCPLMALSAPQRNMETLLRWAEKAKAERADLVLFPEAYITGYATPEMYDAGYADKETFLSLAEPVPGPSTGRLVDISRSLGLFICVGLLEQDRHRRYITQVMIDPEKGFVGRYRKVQVAALEAWFAECGNEFPIFDVLGVPTGIMICRDKSHTEIPRILALEGAQLLLNPHCTHSCDTQPRAGFEDWTFKICATRAMENGCYLVTNNSIFDCPVPDESQSGRGFALDPYGKVLYRDEGPGHTEKMAVIEVDTEIVRLRREAEGEHFNLWSRIPGAYGRLVDPDTPRAPSE